MKKVSLIFFIGLIFGMVECRFEEIKQPKSAQPGAIIEVAVTVYDNFVPEPNPHKGVLAILTPQDWSFISGTYTCDLGSGDMELAPSWADSVEAHYPAASLGEKMKWIALISDSGYAYKNPLTVTSKIKLQVGQTEGQFNLAYLVTKATGGLIGAGDPGWAPLSYPHNIGIPDSAVIDPYFTVTVAPEWDALLDRNSGWTGADGIYSIPLSELEAPVDSGSTLFVFSDTFLGDVDSAGYRKNSKMVNNTYAVLTDHQPNPEQINFYWATDQLGQPKSVFVPTTPNAKPGDWYWLMDGIALNDKIYVFGLRLATGSGGVFNFKVVGVALISFDLDENNAIQNCQQIDTPLFYKNETEGWEIVLGQAVMPMTAASSNPNADGFIYVYGPRDKSGKKELVAGRVLPENFEDFSKWRYWDGQNWSPEISKCAAITDGISQEFSLHPVDEGQFLLVFQFGSEVGIRTGKSPVGPFDFYRVIYNCPEVKADPDIFVYNAKAHPHLSDEQGILISYNVNTFDFWDHFSNADIYRPRFIKLKLKEATGVKFNRAKEIPVQFLLSQNYPNPFNSSTRISFSISKATKIELKIYNLLGQKIKTLIDTTLASGAYSISWDGKDDFQNDVSSGIYIYKIQANEKVAGKKMLLLR